MITKSRHKKLDDKGVQEYTVNRNITLPLLTSVKNFAGRKTTLVEGSKVQGEKVTAQIVKLDKDNKWQPFAISEGIAVVSEGGYYLVPVDSLTWNANPWNPENDTKTNFDGNATVNDNLQEAKEVVSTTIKEGNEKKILGFTYTQLAVIGIVAFVISKIAK